MYSARIFALGAVVAVCGVLGSSAVTGCTTTVEVITLDGSWDSSSLSDSERSGKKDGAAVDRDRDSGGGDASKRDAARDASTEPDANEEPTTCPSNLPFDEAGADAELGPYKIALRSKTCTAVEMTQVQLNLSGAAVWSDVIVGVSSTCARCILTSTGDANWGPIVTLAGAPANGFVNWGACHAALNNSAACGRAVLYTQFCVEQACADCTTTAEETTCQQKVLSAGGVCHTIVNTISTLCPNFATSDAQCGSTVMSSIRALCGP